MMQDAINAIQQFGFPIVMAVGMGYYIYYIWKYVTEEVSPKLEESHINLIKVIDQIRMLDNDGCQHGPQSLGNMNLGLGSSLKFLDNDKCQDSWITFSNCRQDGRS